MTACIPEAHIMFTVKAGVSTGSPAPMPTCRATFMPDPAPSTLPTTTQSISVKSMQASEALAAATPKYTAVHLANEPRKRPCGVRLAETIQIGFITISN